MRWELITSDSALQQVLEENATAPAVAVDTEFMRRDTFFPQVALVQLCFADRAWLVDPLAINDPSPLAQLLGAPGMIKVLHSASEDLEVFDRWLGVLPAPLFDTQRAAALLDRGFGLGYRALVHDICGIDLPKGETRSDWLQRPLTESQCEYAAQDVAHLLTVWQELDNACEQAGKRDWVLSDGRDAVASFGANSQDYYRKVKTAWQLDARQLGCLRAICQWREAVARERDKPRGWILDDRACLAIAKQQPASMDALQRVPDVPPGVVRRSAATLLELIEEQQSLPLAELPPALPSPPGPAQRKMLKTLRQLVRDIAAQLHCAPEVLLQSRDYEALLREADGQSVDSPPHWLGWREQLVLAPVRSRLGGGAR